MLLSHPAWMFDELPGLKTTAKFKITEGLWMHVGN